jgi:hypothetical protein
MAATNRADIEPDVEPDVELNQEDDDGGTGKVVRVRAEALPVSVEDLLARKTMRAMTLNDYTDQCHVALWRAGDQKYMKLLDAVTNSDAVEGNIKIDDMLAAMRLREYAVQHQIEYLQGKKLDAIVKSLKVVLRRYHIGRKERAVMVGGEIV